MGRLTLSTVLGLLLMPMAQAGPGVGLSYLNWDDGRVDREAFRLSLRQSWLESWSSYPLLDIDVSWEASLTNNQVKSGAYAHENNRLWILSASPLVQFKFNSQSIVKATPFIDLGVGLAVLSDRSLGGQELGSRWQFEDRAGFGLLTKTQNPIEFSYHYLHYSNAGLHRPNEGLDFHMVGLVYFW